MKGEADGQGKKPVFSYFIPERTGKTCPTKRSHPCGTFVANAQRDNRDIYRKVERMVLYGITEDFDMYWDLEKN